MTIKWHKSKLNEQLNWNTIEIFCKSSEDLKIIKFKTQICKNVYKFGSTPT